jgi:putative Mn2+ efflux pump MntP
MNYLTIFFIGIGLSMDALAVTLSNAMCIPRLTRAQKLSMPLLFGLFQALMPLGGYFVGSFFAHIIEMVAGPFTLVVLGVLGANMVREGVHDLRKPEEAVEQVFSVKLIVLQAVATSIDALAVGVSFAAYESISIVPAVTIIGLTTFAICIVAVEVGRRLGDRFGARAQVAGGLILITIGVLAMFT